jgi:type I restriction enzyme S subunit
MLPKGWTATTLGKLVTIGSGQSPSLFRLRRRGRYPYVRVDDLNLCLKHQTSSRSYSDDGTMDLVPKGSVLFPKRGAAIMSNKVRIASVPLYMDSNMMAITPSDDLLDSDFLYYLITHEQLHRIADTSTIPQINNKHIIPYRIALPPLREQRAIAAVISAWDRGIEQTTVLTTTKRQFKAALAQQLATRFIPIPVDWAYPAIEAVASEVRVRKPSGAEMPVLSCTKHDGLVDSLSYFSRRVFSEDTSSYKVVKRGQFAYATNHLEEGSIGLLDSVEAGLVSPMYTVFETGSQVHPPFLYKVFKTELYRHIFEVNTSASVNRRGGLRWDDFARIHVPLPSLPEQQRISDCIDTCTAEVRLLQVRLEALKAQERALMRRLLTGQIRVKV